MSRPDLLAAARVFLAALRAADEAEFDRAYQRIANEANDGDLAVRLDARQGLCVAMQAEQARRLFEAAGDDCTTCGAPLVGGACEACEEETRQIEEGE